MVNLSEKETRKKVLDPILERVGWKVKGSYVKEEINPVKSNFQTKEYIGIEAGIEKGVDRFIKNYFICLVKTCDIEELTKRTAEYAVKLERAGYGFDSDIKTLIEELDEQTLKNLEQRMLIKTEGMTNKDEDKIDIVHFLMEIAQEQDDKEKYLRLCERLRGVVPDKEVDYIVWEFDEIGSEPEVF